jgi:hypothetical protein
MCYERRFKLVWFKRLASNDTNSSAAPLDEGVSGLSTGDAPAVEPASFSALAG